MPTMVDARRQVVTGVVPPQLDEATIRTAWPSVTAYPAPAALGELLGRTFILAPLAGLLMAPFYFVKVLPFVATRYRLTNRRLLVLRGLARPQPSQQIDLAAIEDVRVEPGSVSDFYRAGTLEVLSKGQVALKLRGVPEPESFRQAILNACWAWAPRKTDPTPAPETKPAE